MKQLIITVRQLLQGDVKNSNFNDFVAQCFCTYSYQYLVHGALRWPLSNSCRKLPRNDKAVKKKTKQLTDKNAVLDEQDPAAEEPAADESERVQSHHLQDTYEEGL